jgi:hypothetical protein
VHRGGDVVVYSAYLIRRSGCCSSFGASGAQRSPDGVTVWPDSEAGVVSTNVFSAKPARKHPLAVTDSAFG